MKTKDKHRRGEFMGPLDVDRLALCSEQREDPLVMRFIYLADATSRKEFISDPGVWTAQERDAYERGDTVEFSTLRGYSREEIDEFLEFMRMADAVDAKYGADTAASLCHELMCQTEGPVDAIQ